MFGKKTAIQERRRFVRLDASVEIFYSLEANQDAVSCLSKNISAGGICLIVYEPLNAGDTLSLRIYLPDDKPFVVARGKVAWIKTFKIAGEKERYDAGLEFTEINQGDRKRIDNYVFSLK